MQPRGAAQRALTHSHTRTPLCGTHSHRAPSLTAPQGARAAALRDHASRVAQRRHHRRSGQRLRLASARRRVARQPQSDAPRRGARQRRAVDTARRHRGLDVLERVGNGGRRRNARWDGVVRLDLSLSPRVSPSVAPRVSHRVSPRVAPPPPFLRRWLARSPRSRAGARSSLYLARCRRRHAGTRTGRAEGSHA